MPSKKSKKEQVPESSSDDESDDYSAESSSDDSDGEPETTKGKDKGKKKNTPAPTSGKSCSSTPPLPPAPAGATAISSNPFEIQNQVTVTIPLRVVFNPSKTKGLIKIDFRSNLESALEDAHLVAYDPSKKSYTELNAKDLRYFVCSAAVIGVAQNSAPYPLAFNMNVPTTSPTRLHLDQQKKVEDADKDRVKRLNTCHFVLPEEMPATAMHEAFWNYTPKGIILGKMSRFGDLFAGAKSMWGQEPFFRKDKREWRVDANCEGITALKNAGKEKFIRPSADYEDQVWIRDEDKIDVDQRWKDVTKSWGVLETFGLNEEEEDKKNPNALKVVIFRQDKFLKSESEADDPNYWTDLKGTIHEGEGSDVVEKQHVVHCAVKINIGAPLTISNGKPASV